MVEQGTHKPLVGSPNLPLGTPKTANELAVFSFINFGSLTKMAETAGKVYNFIFISCILRYISLFVVNAVRSL